MENEKNNKNNIGKIIFIIAIIVILLGVVGVFAYVRIAEDNCTGNTNNVNSNNQQNTVTRPSNGGSIQIEPDIDYKPIIYLYPQQTTELTVKLGNPEKITCSYPNMKTNGK